jgi:hypothetical protein
MYEWTVKIKIAPETVADGFDLTRDKFYCALLRAYPYMRGSDLEVEIVKAPDPERLAKEMGYIK